MARMEKEKYQDQEFRKMVLEYWETINEEKETKRPANRLKKDKPKVED